MFSSMRSPIPLAAALPAATLLLALGLAGCGSDSPQFPPVCPRVSILADAADLTTFRGTGTDLTDMVVDGRITGIPRTSKCSWGKAGTVHVDLSVGIEVTRGPALKGREAQVPYFISVARGDQILDKRTFVARVHFGENDNVARFNTDPVTMDLPVPGKMQGSDYLIDVGFQLTPDELAFNRRRGPR